jgi:hypothetical protein
MNIYLKYILLIITVLFSYRLIWNILSYPLFPFEPNNLKWCKEWLITTVGDFYCQYLAFILLIFLYKGVNWKTILLAILNATLGSPIALLYLILFLN